MSDQSNAIRPKYTFGLFMRKASGAIKAVRYFVNFPAFFMALFFHSDQQTELRTVDGLSILIRNNVWDARIVWEMFLDIPYLKHVNLGKKPVVIDIGGYIGDFSLYVAKYHNARVLAFEPVQENFEIFAQNIKLNSLNRHITLIPAAVGIGKTTKIRVMKNNQEIHASSYYYPTAEVRNITTQTLSQVLQRNRIGSVDLVKMDCEGGEYDIISSMDQKTAKKIRTIVFELHRVEGFERKKNIVLKKLTQLGYSVIMDGYTCTAHY